MPLSNEFVEEEIERNKKKKLEQIKIGNGSDQNLWDATEAVEKGKVIVVNKNPCIRKRKISNSQPNFTSQ